MRALDNPHTIDAPGHLDVCEANNTFLPPFESCFLVEVQFFLRWGGPSVGLSIYIFSCARNQANTSSADGAFEQRRDHFVGRLLCPHPDMAKPTAKRTIT